MARVQSRNVCDTSEAVGSEWGREGGQGRADLTGLVGSDGGLAPSSSQPWQVAELGVERARRTKKLSFRSGSHAGRPLGRVGWPLSPLSGSPIPG